MVATKVGVKIFILLNPKSGDHKFITPLDNPFNLPGCPSVNTRSRTASTYGKFVMVTITFSYQRESYFSAQIKLSMNYWLVKSDPETYGWNELEKDKTTEWSGIRNYAARIHLKAMKKGDEVLFYHSNQGLNVVGIVTVNKEFFQDSTTTDTAWVSVELKIDKKIKNPVTLAEMKAKKELCNIGLIKIGRLSVMPLMKNEFDLILKMGS